MIWAMAHFQLLAGLVVLAVVGFLLYAGWVGRPRRGTIQHRQRKTWVDDMTTRTIARERRKRLAKNAGNGESDS